MPDSGKPADVTLKETLEENVGLSSYEASVYLALTRGGKQSMSELSDASGVPRQRIYDIVSDLRERGFVEIIDDYPQKAYAVDPEEALSPIQNQIHRTRERLNEIHQAVDEVEGGVALFKSETTIRKYIRQILKSADTSLFLTIPYELLDTFREDLMQRSDVQTRLIISNIDADRGEDAIELDEDVSDLADTVRGVTSAEPFIVCAGRNTGFYWPGAVDSRTTENQGFYITNPHLGLFLDRFLSDSLWPLARPVNPSDTDSGWPTFPKEYVRIRDCLADLKRVTSERALDSFEIEFDGYDTETGEAVTKRGTPSSYYFTKYDLRASLTLDIPAGPDGRRTESVSIGGWRAIREDYEARRLTVYENSYESENALDAETRRHVEACRAELPATFGDQHAVMGIDAFIDRMREIIDERSDSQTYDSMQDFRSFRKTITELEASDKAPRLEWVQTETAAGGHTSHLGQVFDQLNYDLTLIGTFDQPIHPQFEKTFPDQTLFSVGQVTINDYIQFDDGKFLLVDPTFERIDWETITEQIGLEQLAEHVDGAEFLTLGTWEHSRSLPSIWEGICTELWPRLENPPTNVLVSPADVEQMAASTVETGLETLEDLDDRADVTLVTNRDQAKSLLDVVGGGTRELSLHKTAAQLREALGVSKFIVHAPLEASLATADEVLTACAPRPADGQVTNVDAHFDAGLALGMIEGLSDGACLILAQAVAGCFMREQEQPDEAQIRSFIADYDQLFSEQEGLRTPSPPEAD